MRKMIIKGVGRFMARRIVNGVPTREMIDCGTLQSLKIDLNVELEDIFGGDGMFAIDQLLKTKAITVTAVDAKFDLAMVQLLMGGEAATDQSTTLWVLGEQHTPVSISAGAGTAAKITLKKAKAIYAGGLTLKSHRGNEVMDAVPYVADTEPATGKYMINDTGANIEVIMNDELVGMDVVANYQFTHEGVDVLDLMTDTVPFPVTVVHQGIFDQKDGTKQGVQVELYSCIASGTFSMGAERRSASANEVALKVIDPERADGKLGDIKRFAI